jgi:PAS domain S-box-containing protein
LKEERTCAGHPHAGPGLPDSELLKLIFESATDFGIFTMDPNGITTRWNPGARRLFGFHDEEIIGQTADVLFPPEEGGLVESISGS